MYDETKRKRKIVKLAETPYFRWIRVSFNCNQLVQFGKVPRVRIPLSPPWDCLRASAGLACSVFGLILGPPTLGATFYISIAGLANSLHSVSTDCFD